MHPHTELPNRLQAARAAALLAQSVRHHWQEHRVSLGHDRHGKEIAVEWLTRDVFHGEEPLAAVEDELVQGDQVLVLEIGHGAKFAL